MDSFFLAKVKAFYIRSATNEKAYSPTKRENIFTNITKITGPSCECYIELPERALTHGGLIPHFSIHMDGVNPKEEMFPEFEPIFKVEGWNIDGALRFHNPMRAYAEGLTEFGMPMYAKDKEDQEKLGKVFDTLVMDEFSKRQPDLPLEAIEIIYHSFICESEKNLLYNMMQEVKNEFGRKASSRPDIVHRDNELLGRILGLTTEEASEIPSGLTADEFTKIYINDLMDHRRQLVQEAWNCLHSFDTVPLPSHYASLHYRHYQKIDPPLYPYDIEKGQTLYTNTMGEVAFSALRLSEPLPGLSYEESPSLASLKHHDEKFEYAGPAFIKQSRKALYGPDFISTKGDEVQVHEDVRNIINSLNNGTFVEDFKESHSNSPTM